MRWATVVLVVALGLVSRVVVPTVLAAREASLHSDEPEGASQVSALGPFVKSLVYGGLDGQDATCCLFWQPRAALTLASQALLPRSPLSAGSKVGAGGAFFKRPGLIALLTGASMSSRVTLILGTSNLFADAVSMAFGDFVSTRSEVQRRETLWALADARLGPADVSALRQSYVAKGLSGADADVVVAALGRSREALLEAVMAARSTGRPESVDAVANALVTLCSFVGFGSVPLLGYTASMQRSGFMANWSPFARAIGLTAVTLFALGAFESYVTGRDLLSNGLQSLFMGQLAAALAYVLSKWSSDMLAETPKAPRRSERVAKSPAKRQE